MWANSTALSTARESIPVISWSTFTFKESKSRVNDPLTVSICKNDIGAFPPKFQSDPFQITLSSSLFDHLSHLKGTQMKHWDRKWDGNVNVNCLLKKRLWGDRCSFLALVVPVLTTSDPSPIIWPQAFALWPWLFLILAVVMVGTWLFNSQNSWARGSPQIIKIPELPTPKVTKPLGGKKISSFLIDILWVTVNHPWKGKTLNRVEPFQGKVPNSILLDLQEVGDCKLQYCLE